jgi:polyhydroxyalkanoate synthesis repressor PhaR
MRSKPSPPPADDSAPPGLRLLKKYPNRRLYDTQASSYITLADVKQMVLASTPFEVRDAKTSEDLTRSILLQIILEEESGGVPLFSTPMLAQIIRFYGHSMQGLMGQAMERNLQVFSEMQARMVGQTLGQPFGGSSGLMSTYLEQNRAWMEQMQQQTQQLMQEQMKKAATLFPGMAAFPGTSPGTRK